MTNKEKAFNARMKREMQKNGIIPPDKPKLNRKKYVEEAIQEWNDRETGGLYAWDIYLFKAIGIMLGKVDKNLRLTQEAVGVAKCLKLALRLKEFADKLEAEDRTEFTLKEELDFIKDILDA